MKILFILLVIFPQFALCQEEPQPTTISPEMASAVNEAYENLPAPNCVPNFENEKLVGYLCNDEVTSSVSEYQQ